MANEIIPFGKYKGQPVATLQADRDYADWLTAQPWFRERFTGIYQIIVNNFGEPSETPEHNRLQARFLDDGFCRALLVALKWSPASAPQQFIREHMRSAYGLIGRLTEAVDKQPAAIEQHHKTVAWRQEQVAKSPYAKEYLEEAKANLRQQEAKLVLLKAELANAERYAEQPAAEIPITFNRGFEVKGWDVVIDCEAEDAASGAAASYQLYIEIKPGLADDFPAVLRQIKARLPLPSYTEGKPVLVIERFDAAGASFEQVRRIFGFPIITIAEIERAAATPDDAA